MCHIESYRADTGISVTDLKLSLKIGLKTCIITQSSEMLLCSDINRILKIADELQRVCEVVNTTETNHCSVIPPYLIFLPASPSTF